MNNLGEKEHTMVNDFIMDFHVWKEICKCCGTKGIWLAKYAAIMFNGHWTCADCKGDGADHTYEGTFVVWADAA
jgi:hypothetical protein